MARIKIDLPESYLFTITIKVRITDINYGGHLGNDRILVYMQEARTALVHYLGFKDEVNIDGSIGLIMADAGIQYKSESFYGDQLQVNVAATNFSKYGFDLVYHLFNEQLKQEVALAKTGMVCFDYDQKKIASIPDKLKQALTS
ncbi:MAG: thioesterase family protein [Bacteroidota bacterium]